MRQLLTVDKNGLVAAGTGDGYFGEGMFKALGNDLRLTATTGPDAINLSGYFMFMQIITQTVKYTDANNVPHALSLSGIPLHDDGFNFGVPASLGYPTNEGVSAWPSDFFIASTHHFSDGPYSQVDENSKIASVTYSFQTYLMYRPNNGGVWIALQEVDWNMSVSATNNGVFNKPNWVVQSLTQPNPNKLVPSGAAAFPVWKDLSSNSKFN